MSSSNLAVVNGAIEAPYLDREKVQLVKDTILKGANDLELQMFINLCNTKRLDPMTRQIYGIKTGQGLQMFASIDGLRVIAQRSGEYAGQVGPFWCGEDGEWVDVWLQQGKPLAAKVGVLRSGWVEPMWGVATLKSYGKNSPTWNGMVDVMLAKCAESIALRKAFPDDLSGLYVKEEWREPVEVEQRATAPAALPQPPSPKAIVNGQPVVERVIAETGEIAETPETLDTIKRQIKGLAGELGISGEEVNALARSIKARHSTREGALALREHLTVLLADREDQAEAEQEPGWDEQQMPGAIDADFAVAGEAGADRYTDS